jgi:O-methyltransferase
MRPDDYASLLSEVERELIAGAGSVGILGLTTVTLHLLESLRSIGFVSVVTGIYVDEVPVTPPKLQVPLGAFTELAKSKIDLIVVASDEAKEHLLRGALPYIVGAPKVVVSGYGHFGFNDPLLDDETRKLLVPSLANGYPNSLIHLYQCLLNAHRIGLAGTVAEFGMFKGGTTMLLSRLIERLGQDWPVVGFDTFDGFPAPKSPLDMYSHPDCVFADIEAVRRICAGRRIEIVPGDIADTCHRLDREDLILTFIDTDNYTPAKAAISVVQERTVVGGAIVFDHFTGSDRFCYTLGERMAASVLLQDPRYFHLHGTGVFFRQR